MSDYNLTYLEEGKLRWLDAKGRCMIISESGILNMAQGNPAKFSDGSENYVKSCVCDIGPEQDLNGYDKPWPAGGGKNLLPMTLENLKLNQSANGSWNGNTFTLHGISYAVGTDNGGNIISITVNGTATKYTLFRLCGEITFPIETILSGCPESTLNGFKLQAESSDNYPDVGQGVTLPADLAFTRIIIAVPNGASVNNAVFYPRVVDSSLEDQSFSPYSNICPISAHTSVTLNVADDDTTPTVSTDYTTALPQTVYGGTLDMVSGEGMETMANIESYDGEVINEPWLSSMDEYVEGNTPTTGAQVVYTLTDPIPFTTEGQEILSLYGDNVFSSMDDVTVIYLADTKKYIDNAVNSNS